MAIRTASIPLRHTSSAAPRWGGGPNERKTPGVTNPEKLCRSSQRYYPESAQLPRFGVLIFGTGSERVAAGWETLRLPKHMDLPISKSLGLSFLFSASLDSASFKQRSIIQWCKISFKHEFKLALADFALP